MIPSSHPLPCGLGSDQRARPALDERMYERPSGVICLRGRIEASGFSAMVTTFSQVARDVAGKYLAAATIKNALDPLGAKAEQATDTLDVERRRQLATQFVRALRNVGVADSTRIEHELFTALGAAPTQRRSIPIKDAISLIAIRNHVQQLATAVGMPWGEGMQVQSAISDVARFLSQNGGGRIETEATAEGRIHVEVVMNRGLAPIVLATPPMWLIGVVSIARGFHELPAGEGAGARFEFWINMTVALVA